MILTIHHDSKQASQNLQNHLLHLMLVFTLEYEIKSQNIMFVLGRET